MLVCLALSSVSRVMAQIFAFLIAAILFDPIIIVLFHHQLHSCLPNLALRCLFCCSPLQRQTTQTKNNKQRTTTITNNMHQVSSSSTTEHHTTSSSTTNTTLRLFFSPSSLPILDIRLVIVHTVLLFLLSRRFDVVVFLVCCSWFVVVC